MIYRCLGRKGREASPRNQVEETGDQVADDGETEVINYPQEMSGYQEHELSAGLRYLTQELPQPANRIQNPQELSSQYVFELQASVK